MNREELAHVIRAAADIVDDGEILVVSKLVAGREKDFEFTRALIRAGVIDVDLLADRARSLQTPGAVVERVITWARRISDRVEAEGLP